MLKKDWEVSVERPIGDVFAAFAERAGRVPVWDGPPDLGEVRKLTKGPVGKGTRYLLEADLRSGRHVEGTVEVTGFDPDRILEVAWSSEGRRHWDYRLGGAGAANVVFVPGWGSRGTLEARFTEDDRGTRVTLHSENNLSGWYILASFILRWIAYRRMRQNLARFKAAVERPSD